MPRNVRNFWLELDVDGSKSRVETGPRSKDGGFALRIRMRDKGSIAEKVVRIEGRVMTDGTILQLLGFVQDAVGEGEIDHNAIVVRTER